MKKTITFETKCWENDWEHIILNGGYKRKLQSFDENQFDKKLLIINNVNNPLLVCKEADKLVSENIIDEWYLTEDTSKEVLNHFGIDKESFNKGYYYSISELTAIYFTKTDYLLHLSSDSNVEILRDVEWVNPAIAIMEENNKVVCANPTWNHLYSNAKAEADAGGYEDDDWYYMPRFSDQCYLIPQKYFNQKIYNEKNKMADIYFPTYGGELFEKRVYSHIANNGLYTITNKHISYSHPNY